MKYYFVIPYQYLEKEKIFLDKLILYIDSENIVFDLFHIWCIDLSTIPFKVYIQSYGEKKYEPIFFELVNGQRTDLLYFRHRIFFCASEIKQVSELDNEYWLPYNILLFNEEQYNEWQYEKTLQFSKLRVVLSNPPSDGLKTPRDGDTIYIYTKPYIYSQIVEDYKSAEIIYEFIHRKGTIEKEVKGGFITCDETYKKKGEWIEDAIVKILTTWDQPWFVDVSHNPPKPRFTNKNEITDFNLNVMILSFLGYTVDPHFPILNGQSIHEGILNEGVGYAISKRRAEYLPQRSWKVIAIKERFQMAEEKQEEFVYKDLECLDESQANEYSKETALYLTVKWKEEKNFLVQWKLEKLKIQAMVKDKAEYYLLCQNKLIEMKESYKLSYAIKRLSVIYEFLNRYFNDSTTMQDNDVLKYYSFDSSFDYTRFQWLNEKHILRFKEFRFIYNRENHSEKNYLIDELSRYHIIMLYPCKTLANTVRRTTYCEIKSHYPVLYDYPYIYYISMASRLDSPCLYFFELDGWAPEPISRPFKSQVLLASKTEVEILLKQNAWIEAVEKECGLKLQPMPTDIITDELPPMESACVLPAKNVLQALDNEKKQEEVLGKIGAALGESYKDRLTMTQVCDAKTNILHYNVSIDPLAASEPEETGSAEIEEVDNVSQSKPIMEIHNDKIVVPNGWQLGFPDHCKFNDNKVMQEAQRLVAMAKAALDTYIATKELTAQDFFKQGKKKQMIKTSGSNKEMQAIIEALLTVDTKNAQNKPILSEKYTIVEDLRTAINQLLQGDDICQIDEKQTIKRLYSDCLMFKQKKELSNDVAGIKNTLTKLPV